MLELLFLLLPVAAGYGWVMGRNSVRQAQRKQSSILSRHYYRGLNFLLSDEPDKAVDTLIKMIDLDSDTVETHIAMGKFFRHNATSMTPSAGSGVPTLKPRHTRARS